MALRSCCSFHSTSFFSVHKKSSLVVEKNLPCSFSVRMGGHMSLRVPWRVPSQLRSSNRKATLRQDQVCWVSPQRNIASAVAYKYKSRAKALWQDSHKPHLDLAEETQTMQSKRLKPVNSTRLWKINSALRKKNICTFLLHTTSLHPGTHQSKVVVKPQKEKSICFKFCLFPLYLGWNIPLCLCCSSGLDIPHLLPSRNRDCSARKASTGQREENNCVLHPKNKHSDLEQDPWA